MLGRRDGGKSCRKDTLALICVVVPMQMGNLISTEN